MERLAKLKNQKGFTLIELLIAGAITTIIGGLIALALSQVVTISGSGSKQMEAIKQVENAAYQINRDAQAANGISVSSQGYWLVITLADNSTIDYQLITPGSNLPAYLQRTHGGSTTEVARYIDNRPNMTVCSYSGGVLNAKVTVTLNGLRSATETREMTVYNRLKQ